MCCAAKSLANTGHVQLLAGRLWDCLRAAGALQGFWRKPRRTCARWGCSGVLTPFLHTILAGRLAEHKTAEFHMILYTAVCLLQLCSSLANQGQRPNWSLNRVPVQELELGYHAQETLVFGLHPCYLVDIPILISIYPEYGNLD